LNARDPELLELLDSLANGTAARSETLREIAFGRQTLARAIATCEDLISKRVCDFVRT
jgi:hypothetical protein